MSHFYFYHYIPKGANLNPGLVSLKYMYEHGMNEEFYNSSYKYRDRLVNAWGYYPNKIPEELTNEEIIDGLNRFRESEYGASYIYFFRYKLNPSLGLKIRGFLDTHDCITIDLDNPILKKEIADIYWGTEGSHSDAAPLDERYYRNIKITKYFSKYDDKAVINFAALNHIGIRFKKDYLPRNLFKIER